MWSPSNDSAGIGLMMRARQWRDEDDQQSQDYADSIASALGDPRLAWNTRWNNNRARAMADPQWDAYFQAVDEAAGGRQVKMVGGAAPAGSNAFRGTSTQTRPMRPSVQRLFVGDGRPVLPVGRRVLQT